MRPVVLAWIAAALVGLVVVPVSVRSARTLQAQAEKIRRSADLVRQIQDIADAHADAARAYRALSDTPAATNAVALPALAARHQLVVADRRERRGAAVEGFVPVQAHLQLGATPAGALLRFLADAAALQPPWTLDTITLHAVAGTNNLVTAELTLTQFVPAPATP